MNALLKNLSASDRAQVERLLANKDLTFSSGAQGELVFTSPSTTDRGTHAEWFSLSADGQWQYVKCLSMTASACSCVLAHAAALE